MTYPRPVPPVDSLPDNETVRRLMAYYETAADRHEAVAVACNRVAHNLDVLSVALSHLPGARADD